MIKKGIRRIEKEDILFILFCVLTAVIFASYRCVNGDFVAYNGDFQNYNIFRRLLDGQVSYRDFTNYLGSGVVFVNLPLVFFFRSFGASVFITHFTTSVLYSLILCVLFYTVCRDRKRAYVISNLVSAAAFVIIHAGFYGTFYYQYVYDFVYFEEQGISMRTTRAFLPFMFTGIFYIIKNVIKRKKILSYCFRSYKILAGIFLVFGMHTVWSNDYGYSSVICLFLIFLIVNLCCEKMAFTKRIGLAGAALASAAAGIFLSVEVITVGNLKKYISVNAGIADYQFWYYGNYYNKYLTAADIFSDRKFIFLTVIFLLHGIWFIIRALMKKIGDYSICKLFLHSTCYGAALIYVLGSGSHNYSAVEMVTYVLCGEMIVRFIQMAAAYIRKISARRVKTIIQNIEMTMFSAARALNQFHLPAYILIMLLLYTFAMNIIRSDISYTDRDTVEGLQIDSVLGAGLDECAADIAGENIFSTYAGALEAINGIFQPTGTDYIIHVLGDKQREDYLDDFANGDYRYVQTLKNEYTHCEYWSSRVNWFFYRELYKYYEPVKETNYSVIWEKSKKEHIVKGSVEIDKTRIDDSTCRIDVRLPNYPDGAYVDLYIKYDTKWKADRWKNGGLKKVLCVEDGGEQYNSFLSNSCYYLRDRSDGCHIPVYVRDGKGSVQLSAYPLSCTELTEMEAHIDMVIEEPEFALHLANYKDIYSTIANDTVDITGTLLKFDNTEFNMTALQYAKSLTANGETAYVSSMWQSGDYIYVQSAAPVTKENFVYPNKITAAY